MKNIVLLLSIVGFALSSCVKTDDFKLVSVDDIASIGTSGADILVTVENKSRKNISIDDTRVTIYNKGNEIAVAVIPNGISIPKKFYGQIEIPVRIKISDPIRAGAIMLSQNFETLTVSGHVTVKAGSLKKTVIFEEKPLMSFYRQISGYL